jgi:glycine dehydrogenase subunit 2
MHEFVASVKDLKKSHKIKAYDVGKALLDKGFHSPTIYFPLIVEEALMFEPTETQSKETLDDLASNLKLIVDEDYPKNLPVGRPNELIPAKYLTVNWGDFELLEITE